MIISAKRSTDSVVQRGLSSRKKRRLDVPIKGDGAVNLSMFEADAKCILTAATKAQTFYFKQGAEGGGFDLQRQEECSVICSGPLFDGSAIVEVTTDSIRLLNTGGFFR